jgi:hypothetical protein
MKTIAFFIACILISSSMYAQWKAFADKEANKFSVTDDFTGDKIYYLVQKNLIWQSEKPNGEFSLTNRKIEFEYQKPETIIDSQYIQVIVRITSGFDEGKLANRLMLITDDEMTPLNFTDVLHKEYVYEENRETSSTKGEYQWVTSPGGVEVVIRQDGTHEHVIKQSSSQYQYTTVPDEERVHIRESQYYNQGKLSINTLLAAKIFTSKKIAFKLYFDESAVLLKTTPNHNIELKNFIKNLNNK